MTRHNSGFSNFLNLFIFLETLEQEVYSERFSLTLLKKEKKKKKAIPPPNINFIFILYVDNKTIIITILHPRICFKKERSWFAVLNECSLEKIIGIKKK